MSITEALDALQPVVDVRALWEQFLEHRGTTGLLQWKSIFLYVVVGLLVFAWQARGSEATARDALRSLVPRQLSSPAVKLDLQFFLYDLTGVRRVALIGISTVIGIPLLTRGVRALHLWTLPGLSKVSDWAVHLDPIAQSALAFLLAALGSELCFYWYHRAAHEIEFLWQFHRVHHFSEEMNPMVAVRVHDFDETLQIQALFLGGLLFVGLLFPLHEGDVYDESAYWMVGVYQALLQISTRFTHTDIPFTLGPILDRILNTAVLHQMHHSRDIPNKNFGQNLSLWDTVFGTFLRPKPDEVVRFGVEGMTENQYRHLIHSQIQGYRDAWGVLRAKLGKAPLSRDVG